MRSLLLYAIISISLVACKQTKENRIVEATPAETEKTERPIIRWIRFYGTDDSYGVELNGERAFYRAREHRAPVAYERGLALLEDFYGIPGIANYLGRADTVRNTDDSFLITIFDELPQHYSEEWVDYVIPKGNVALDNGLDNWFSAMAALKAEQAVPPKSDRAGG